MKKYIVSIVSACMLLLLLSACGGDKVDEETSEKMIQQAEDVVQFLNDQQYEELRETFDSTLKKELTEERLKELEPIFEESGAFEKFEKSSVEEKDGHYIVVLVAKHANDQRIFTVTINKSNQVSGLFVK
ncbi:DUF3887 domain-containing protein [Bacillus sp. FJAT-42315]|uniref:DUF3887 domain-containing protein n=1 Tax=Bacillus sp. FJAT-42315 TaxID=2014077 RepID=UPI001E57B20A|nr:DUF3887 domain-containing protein [Bacillus sp. FJAT-42315]